MGVPAFSGPGSPTQPPDIPDRAKTILFDNFRHELRAALSATPGAASVTRERVLVAHDNADMRQYLCRLLAPHWEVEAVADGFAALEAVHRHSPDVVLSDVMILGPNGFELLRALRRDAATRGVSVILLTARAGESDAIEGLEAGADDYLAKPFTALELLARVRVHLELAHLRRESETKPLAVLGSIADGFVMIDRQWHLTYANRKAELLAAADPGGLVGKRLWDALPALAGPAARFRYEEAISGEAPSHFEVKEPAGDRSFEVRAYPSNQGLSLFFFDVTERTRNDEALRRFVAYAAHELRSPLGMLVATASLLSGSGGSITPWRLERAIELIGRQGERAHVLINDLLDLSVSQHDVPVELVPVSLRAVVRDATKSAPSPPDRSVEVDIADDLAVLAEPNRLERILINLLTNAYRYGGDTISLRAHVTGATVDVVVSDNGLGVPADFVPHLFEPFSRAAGAGSEGSGLGLAIVRALVGALGGDLWYETGPGGEAQFVFRLSRG